MRSRISEWDRDKMIAKLVCEDRTTSKLEMSLDFIKWQIMKVHARFKGGSIWIAASRNVWCIGIKSKSLNISRASNGKSITKVLNSSSL
eukprot:CAMPEP_0197324664 /NCGR_PEP_ID=MMETSP0891-20130614/71232_1 /TAXON_ID=44058 ORGANISM="Aureoumbra lagunensis, Strain CCMP1510" /NCGR_SAMPLE_ID=MMETSP0891 /ASSEMBLY_ACC=CAM_ASM_000534 /LENGTH=88 /DNA_ID=CAMNT_0042817503 /DNA_START=846 /DNA_END=1112 /DNA_ORIENTATION=-